MKKHAKLDAGAAFVTGQVFRPYTRPHGRGFDFAMVASVTEYRAMRRGRPICKHVKFICSNGRSFEGTAYKTDAGHEWVDGWADGDEGRVCVRTSYGRVDRVDPNIFDRFAECFGDWGAA
jgi:hypothetical protein